ncbi:hypothetical protein HK101_005592 [Irineochytrium annulatum]|nr:hypothetical protein HK101_005592 [Irineochytrium annulatum]
MFEVNRYVGATKAAGKPTVDEAMAQLLDRFPRWMWHNQPVREFVSWLKVYNDDLKKNGEEKKVVGMLGMDIYSMYQSAKEVINYLEKMDPRMADFARDRYGLLMSFEPEAENYCSAVMAERVTAQQENVTQMLVELLLRELDYVRARNDEDEFFSASEYAKLVADAEEYYRVSYLSHHRFWNIRDGHMVETVEHALRYFDRKLGEGYDEASKCVIWAHNSHLGDSAATEHGRRGRHVNLGHLVRERFGLEKSFILGLCTYEGTVRAARAWNGQDYVMDLLPSLRGSTGDLLHQVRGLVGSDFVLTIRGAESDALKVLEQDRLERFVGVQYKKRTERRSHYSACKLAGQYDGVVHLDKTSAIKLIAKAKHESSVRPGTIDYSKWEHLVLDDEDIEEAMRGLISIQLRVMAPRITSRRQASASKRKRTPSPESVSDDESEYQAEEEEQPAPSRRKLNATPPRPRRGPGPNTPSKRAQMAQRRPLYPSADEEDSAESDSGDEITLFRTHPHQFQDGPVAPLKFDHDSRPLFVQDDGKIILEAFSPIADHASDFLTAVAEPVSRPHLIHEFRLTEYSLLAAVSVGLHTASIIEVLAKLCKSDPPEQVIEFIRAHTMSYGKVKLVLKDNKRYFVESADMDVLRLLLKSKPISDARIKEQGMDIPNISADGLITEIAPTSSLFAPSDGAKNGAPAANGEKAASPATAKGTKKATKAKKPAAKPAAKPATKPVPTADTEQMLEKTEIDLFDMFNDDDIDTEKQDGDAPAGKEEEDDFADLYGGPENIGAVISVDNEDNDGDDELAHQDPVNNLSSSMNAAGVAGAPPSLVSLFEIYQDKVESVRKTCSEMKYPMLEEYDFRNDRSIPELKIDLKATTRLRPYQEKALNKVFGNGRARSGIIVLPCGAGKTLVGVTAACTIRKSCLVLCTSSVSVEQWAREFKSWSTINDNDVARFTSERRDQFPGQSGVLISTYSMISYSGKRAYDAKKVMEFICSREWGFLLLDEVHVVPAEMFRKVLTIVAAHAKLGLTATLVREDDKIESLNYLIGPKLYEANWIDLAKKGHIANVQCAEVWCEMTLEFYREYLEQSANPRKRQLLFSLNPRKIQACQYLIEFHEARGEKIIVFSDNIFALKHYAQTLGKFFIYGGTSQAERLRILGQFRYNPALNTIFLSKVGDTSIDIPEASVLIQISSHYGSRRQEAQRLGRILRAKKSNTMSTDGFNAYFYTEEVYYSSKRQQFLIDQGYSFKIITQLAGSENNMVYSTLAQRLELLTTILLTGEDMNAVDIEEDDAAIHELEGNSSSGNNNRVTQTIVRRSDTLKSLSGADSMAYIEQARGTRRKQTWKDKD